MFLAYWKTNRKIALALLLIVAVFAGVFALYRLPVQAVAYAAVICLFFGGIWFAADYRKFALRHRTLQRLCEAAELGMECLPPPEGALEADYQALVRAQDAVRRELTDQMQRRYADMNEYYTVWAHQIKTPIAAMRLLLQSGEGEANRALSDELQRIEQYVEMVLGYLRLESRSSDYVIRSYDLDGIVRPAVRKFASQFIHKKLRLDYEPVQATVLTDEKWLLFVIEQVLSNALKYTRTGGITITLEEPKTLCIRDTGIGIAPEDLPRVFEQGFTGYNGRDDKRATGIGLYLCRRILTRLGHTITIESELGAGTAVRIGLDREPFTVE